MNQEKIHFSEAQETMLITLYSKARGCPPAVFDDEKARQILAAVDYDFKGLRVPIGTRLTVCVRAKRLDDYVRDYLNKYPTGLVLHLACGLDSRCTRVAHPQANWFDLDLPDVIALRGKFFQEDALYHMLASSATDPSWLQALPDLGQPAIIIAEGLMMYLPEAEVKSLVLRLKQALPGSRLAFDAYSTLTARNVGRHPSLKKTGAMIHWGIDDAHQIESWAPGIRLEEEWFFDQSADIPKMGAYARFMFSVAGLFSMARKAQRILVYRLGGL